MGTEIAKAAATRDQVLAAMTPVSERYGSDQYQQNRTLICFELEIASRKVDRFGWDALDDAVKDRLTQDWADVLDRFPLAEVQRGIGDRFGVKPSKCPNEYEVKAAIDARRAKALRDRPQPAPPEAAKDRGTAEERQAAAEAILAQTGFAPKRMPKGGE